MSECAPTPAMVAMAPTDTRRTAFRSEHSSVAITDSMQQSGSQKSELQEEMSASDSMGSTCSSSNRGSDSDDREDMIMHPTAGSFAPTPRVGYEASKASARATVFASYELQPVKARSTQTLGSRGSRHANGLCSRTMTSVQSFDSLPTQGSKQRKMVKIFPRGTFVDIYSGGQQQWFLDGEVVDVAWDSDVRDGKQVAAGSTKIIYAEGTRFQWVESHNLQTRVRKNGRPKQPDPLKSLLTREARSWLGVSWKWCYVELRRGTLEWWDNIEQAASVKAVGTIDLVGVQLERQGLQLKLISPHGTKTFQATTKELASVVSDALSAHIAFSDEDRLFFEAHKRG